MTPTNNGSHQHRAGESPEPGPEVGTVAEEAALLVEVLSGRYSSPGHGDGDDARTGSAGAGRRQDEPAAEPPPAGERSCTCGGTRPAACAVCPVCQLLAFVQRISPETIDRLADAVELAATGLRDLATVQRDRRGGPDEPGPPHG